MCAKRVPHRNSLWTKSYQGGASHSSLAWYTFIGEHRSDRTRVVVGRLSLWVALWQRAKRTDSVNSSSFLSFSSLETCKRESLLSVSAFLSPRSRWVSRFFLSATFLRFLTSEIVRVCVRVCMYVLIIYMTILTFPSGLHTLIPASDTIRRTDVDRSLYWKETNVFI